MSASDAEDANRPGNEPLYHHFIPQFYLRRWGNSERKVCRFSKPYDSIIPKMVGIRGTGGQEGLYTFQSASAIDAQWIEKGPMKIIDTAASEALKLLETGDDRIRTESAPRSAWSCFLMSMMMRGPRDIEAIKASLSEEWAKQLPDVKARIEAIAGEKGRGFSEYLAEPGSPLIDDWALQLAVDLMDHSGMGQLINNMTWFVKDIPEDGPELLASDRPVMFSGTLSQPDDYIIMPISPRKLFVATKTVETARRAWAYDPVEQAKGVNRYVVARAQQWVYATSAVQLEFVREHMGTKPEKSLFERLAEFRRQNSS